MTTKIDQLKTMLADSPNDSFLKHALGLEMIKIGRLADARQYFEDIIKTEPSYVGTYYHLAQLYIQLNAQHEAQKTFEQGLQEAHKQNQKHAYNELMMAYQEWQEEQAE